MPVTPLRVGIDQIDQLPHGVRAIAEHLRRIASGGRHHAVAHHQQPVVAAGQEALDHHVADLCRGAVGDLQVFAIHDVDGDALALVAVLRLDDDRQADLQRDRPGFVHGRHRPAIGHRHAGGQQQCLRQVLVLRNRFGHGAGDIDLGRLDAPLTRAPAELHQAALREPPPRDTTGCRRIDDGAGARAEPNVLVGFAQAGDGCIDVVGPVVHRRGDEFLGQLERLPAHLLFAVLDDHLVDAGFDRGRSAAESHRATCLGLQRQRCRFEDMRE